MGTHGNFVLFRYQMQVSVNKVPLLFKIKMAVFFFSQLGQGLIKMEIVWIQGLKMEKNQMIQVPVKELAYHELEQE